ncbi:hypothetical protein GRS96_03260 [Rathayibacter sp. VKM Ac-2803]|uniref:hypothetical protein n=1 Tax=Rathayibacter sp. VKM Ac-2803 TaxID=2609256 RepID=UPI00135737B5|nr:hypothetical protein [Rathayibacter sp. VKM Ac-2803]MWV48293.1 hypothetical protein [Rathayibacter sp. VKM Ac-2803]
MPSLSDSSRPVLRTLIDAFADPGAVDAGYAAHVLSDARELLDIAPAQRMPTLLFPRSAVFDVPDAPPVPPGAL